MYQATTRKRKVIKHPPLDCPYGRKRPPAPTRLETFSDDVAEVVSNKGHRKRMEACPHYFTPLTYHRRTTVLENLDNYTVVRSMEFTRLFAFPRYHSEFTVCVNFKHCGFERFGDLASHKRSKHFPRSSDEARTDYQAVLIVY